MESSRRKEKLRQLSKVVCSNCPFPELGIKGCVGCRVNELINMLLEEC